MANYSTASPPGSHRPFNGARLLRYSVLGLAANALVWGFAFLMLHKKPTYESSWTFTIPPAVKNTNINLPGLGGASDQSRSPFGINGYDPRENYKNIITSGQVLGAATDRTNPRIKVNKPRVEIVDNTTLMSLAITGGTPEEAQKKAQALNDAFEERLNELRLQESTRQDQGVQAVLSNARRKLEQAQQRLSEYKAQSGFVSAGQIDQLSNNIEELRKLRAQTVAGQEQASARLGQLSSTLKLSPNLAGEAFVLKADPLFQKYLLNYSEANAALVVLTSKFGPNHPVVVRERARQDSARTALLARSQSLLNRPVDERTLARLNIGEGSSVSSLENLFQNLVVGQVDQRGLTAQAQELNRQITTLEGRLGMLAKQGATLEALERDRQIAETVFSSTLARLDVAKLDAFGSYPSVQVLDGPDLPDEPVDPNKKVILLGSTLCSLFILSALISFWTRKRWLPRVAGSGRTMQPESALSDPPLLSPTAKSAEIEARSN